MKYQTPAQGIMLTKDWSDAKTFHVECECTDPDHAVQMWVETDLDKDIDAINVSFYVKTTNAFWKEGYSRIRAAWEILTKGVHQQEHHLLLDQQSAINFAGAITNSIKELEKRRG